MKLSFCFAKTSTAATKSFSPRQKKNCKKSSTINFRLKDAAVAGVAAAAGAAVAVVVVDVVGAAAAWSAGIHLIN